MSGNSFREQNAFITIEFCGWVLNPQPHSLCIAIHEVSNTFASFETTKRHLWRKNSNSENQSPEIHLFGEPEYYTPEWWRKAFPKRRWPTNYNKETMKKMEKQVHPGVVK